MDDAGRMLPWPPSAPSAGEPEPLEWLVANGLGGYASGTLEGALTRRYHGLLIAALPVPYGRTVMLDQLVETLVLPDGRRLAPGCRQVAPQPAAEPIAEPAGGLVEFRLHLGLPVWRYVVGGIVLERSLTLLYGENTLLITWRRLPGTGGPADATAVGLEVRPFLNVRPHDAPVREADGRDYRVTPTRGGCAIEAGGGLPPLRLHLPYADGTLTLDGDMRQEIAYATEAARGYDWQGRLWSPGRFACSLAAGDETALIASVEPWERVARLRPADAARHELGRRRALIERAEPGLRASPGRDWVLAADAFIVRPPREAPATEAPTTGAQATGAQVRQRSIIAGYPWFTDWGRDTMISLEGLTLSTGRHAEAAGILRTFARHVRDGLIPNFFSEHEGAGHYHTADATLWFAHALDRYVVLSGDRDIVGDLLPTLRDIIDRHLHGTRFGIGVDPQDGLLRQGAAGYQLTWMDAKIDDWVITPRRGKAVEINALWYNALVLMQGWLAEHDDDAGATRMAALAVRARASFNSRFWCDQAGHLFDVVDGEVGDDPSCRPNQILALSLPHPVLDRERWEAVLSVVARALLTPVGLRSLSPRHPDYQRRCVGDLRARDAAYHQGTVWGWLIGPFVDAWVRVHPHRRSEARRFLDGFANHLDVAGVGSVSEIFDAEPPHTPRGCIAQAWSVAEVLRAYCLTAR